MEHSFDVDVANEYGVTAAVLLKHLHFWLLKNKANCVNYFDGLYWTYNSGNAFVELFPYLSRATINRTLSKLEEEGLVKSGNYNQNAYDRTKWYALTDKGWELLGSSNEEMDYSKTTVPLPKMSNGTAQNESPIPDNKPYSKPDIYNPPIIPPTRGNAPTKRRKFVDDVALQTAIEDFVAHRKALKKPMTDRAVEILTKKLEKLAPNDVDKQIALIDEAIEHGWQTVYAHDDKVMNNGGGRKSKAAQELDEAYKMIAEWAESD